MFPVIKRYHSLKGVGTWTSQGKLATRIVMRYGLKKTNIYDWTKRKSCVTPSNRQTNLPDVWVCVKWIVSRQHLYHEGKERQITESAIALTTTVTMTTVFNVGKRSVNRTFHDCIYYWCFLCYSACLEVRGQVGGVHDLIQCGLWG